MRQHLFTSDLFLKAQTDERLAALCREGYAAAFSVLVDRHRRMLLGHACRLVGRERGEDVLQQALLKAWRSIQEGAEVQHPQAWLHRIVHNTGLTEIERQPQAADPLDENVGGHRPSAAASAEERLELLQVLRGLADLPQRERLALLGTELEGRSRSQLATELGLSEGAVRQLVYRARRRVRAGIAVLVPFPLVDRAMRAWARTSTVQSPLGQAAVAARGTGVLAGGAVKVAAVVVAAGAIGGGVLLHGHSAGRHPRRPLTEANRRGPSAVGASRGAASSSATLLALGRERVRRDFPAGSAAVLGAGAAAVATSPKPPSSVSTPGASIPVNTVAASPPIGAAPPQRTTAAAVPTTTTTEHSASPQTSDASSVKGSSPDSGSGKTSQSGSDATSQAGGGTSTQTVTSAAQQDTTTAATQPDHPDSQSGTTTTQSGTVTTAQQDN